MSIDSLALEQSIQRLFPNQDPDQVLVELLLERAQKNLVKYRTMDRQFQAEYGEKFETWRQSVLDSEPPFQTEQDYFDWEMAVTGIADMQEEIGRLRGLKQQP